MTGKEKMIFFLPCNMQYLTVALRVVRELEDPGAEPLPAPAAPLQLPSRWGAPSLPPPLAVTD